MIEKQSKILVAAVENNRHYLTELHQRGKGVEIDYVKLAQKTGGEYMDNSCLRNPDGFFANRKFDASLAGAVAWNLRKNPQFRDVVSMSEGIGIPLAILKKVGLIDPDVNIYVTMHHPMSNRQRDLASVLPFTDSLTRIFCLSSMEAQAYTALMGIDSDKVGVLHSTIDPNFFTPAATKEGKYALSMGVSDRDYPGLVEAMKKAPSIETHISATSLWAEHKASGLEIPSNVIMENCSDPLSIKRVVQNAKVVIVPIRLGSNQYSAGCTSLLLAGAMGVPAIYTREHGRSGLDDYAIPGETAIAVESGNPEALREAVVNLWNNPKQAREMGERARQFVTANFSIDEWIKRTVNKVHFAGLKTLSYS